MYVCPIFVGTLNTYILTIHLDIYTILTIEILRLAYISPIYLHIERVLIRDRPDLFFLPDAEYPADYPPCLSGYCQISGFFSPNNRLSGPIQL